MSFLFQGLTVGKYAALPDIVAPALSTPYFVPLSSSFAFDHDLWILYHNEMKLQVL